MTKPKLNKNHLNRKFVPSVVGHYFVKGVQENMIKDSTEYKVNITYPNKPNVCPSCGRCNECGRGENSSPVPYVPSYPYYPKYPYNGSTWS